MSENETLEILDLARKRTSCGREHVEGLQAN